MRSARFLLDHCARFTLLSAEQSQSPGSYTRAKASFGRFSGAVHGGNSRKGRVHKRSDTVKQEKSQEHESLQRKELVDEHSPQHDDDHMFCDDFLNDQVADCHLHPDTTPGIDGFSNFTCTDSQLGSTSAYDSIRGEFWMNDPYYQEFEASYFQDGSLHSEDKSLRSKNSLVDNQGGNGGVVASENGNISDTRTNLQTSAAEVHNLKSGEPSSSFQEPVDVGESNQQLNLDYQEISHGEINSGEDMVREVESAERPSISFGSLQNIEVHNLENRTCSGTRAIDETIKEHKTDPIGALPAVIITSEDWNADRDSDMTSVTGKAKEEVTGLEDATTLPVGEQVGQVVEQVADLIADSIKEQVGSVVDQVEKLPGQVSQAAEQVVLKVVDHVTDVLPEPMVEQVGQVAEQVTQTAEQIVEQVTTHVVDPISTTATQIANFLSSDEEDFESDDEFEAYTSLDIPEFKGREGLNNFTILQEEQGFLSIIYDFYIFMLKRSVLEFCLGMFSAPVLLSVIFTILYLPQFNGLALDETLRDFLQTSDQKGPLEGLQLSWETVFRVFMFSVSLSTGLQPELAPLSPYTLVVANLNALFAQLIFVFLSGAVFARLSQPSQPVKCSTIAVICPPPSNRRLRKETSYKALLTRYVLVGPQPCELVDVKVDLTYHYNTVTRTGSYFRTSQSLKLVRPEIAFLDHGMLVRHIIDETSPLYQRTPGMLEKEDAVFSLSVVGLERSSMQSVFHVQHYCVYDNEVIWDAEFVDMILISKKNRRVVDHSLLSHWRTVVPR